MPKDNQVSDLEKYLNLQEGLNWLCRISERMDDNVRIYYELTGRDKGSHKSVEEAKLLVTLKRDVAREMSALRTKSILDA